MKKYIPTSKSEINSIIKTISLERAREVLSLVDSSYYNDEEPLMSDSLYDLFRDALNQKFPELRSKVGASVDSSFAGREVPLTMKMGSLQKVNTEEEFNLFFNKYTSGSVVGSLKLDGYSAELVYQNGEMVRATTRGNGVIGKDITDKVMLMKSIPKKLSQFQSGQVVIRGEIYLKKSFFEKYFLPLGLSNPRNAIARPLNSLNGDLSEYLSFSPFDILPEGHVFKTKVEVFNCFKDLGFECLEHKLFSSKEEAQSFFYLVEIDRAELDFLIDGVVFEENDLFKASELGEVDNRPRASRAYKFENEHGESVLLSVEWNTGRTGKVTPTAILRPCFVGGVTISRGTLNNPHYIEGLGVKIGSRVRLERANDVIPKVTEVIEGGHSDIIIPENCPSCGEKLSKLKDKNIQCTNTKNCKSQIIERVDYFLKSLEIKGVGEGNLQKLADKNLLTGIKDLFNINENPNIDGFSWVNFNKAKKTLINLSVEGVELSKFIEAIAISGVGKSNSLKISEIINSELGGDILSVLSNPDVIKKNSSLGEVVGENFLTGVEGLKEEISDLLKLIKINHPKTKSGVSGKYSGEVFCFTGFRDKDLARELESLGGVVSDSFNKKVTTLIVKDINSTSSKVKDAVKSGIKVASLDEFKGGQLTT